MKRIVSVWLKDWPITAWSWAKAASAPSGPRADPGAAAADPFALVARGPRGLVLAGLNPAARALGLRLGQAHADACAVAPALKSEPVKPGQAQAALKRLALWAQRYAPLVALDEADAASGLEGLWIETTGSDHLFGGEAAMLADLTARLARAGAVAQVGLAGTPGAAWALARFASPYTSPYPSPRAALAPPGGEAAALASLPVEALRVSPAAVQLLARFGLRRIGDLYALPRAALARRFRGDEGMQVMLRLDQALGRMAEPLVGESPPPAYFAQRTFAEPILHTEGVARWGARLAHELCAKLEGEGLGARRLALTGFGGAGRTTGFSAALGLASRDPDHLIRLLRERGWARLEVGFGLDALRLSADATEPLAWSQEEFAAPPCSDASRDASLKLLTRPARDGRQISVGTLGVPLSSSTPPEGPNTGHGPKTDRSSFSFSPSPVFDAPQAVELQYGTPRVPTLSEPPSRAGRVKGLAKRPLTRPSTAAQPKQMAVLIDRLTARLGEKAVLAPAYRESWLPERAERLAPYAATQSTGSAQPPTQPRPILLFTPPEPIEAMAELPDGAPARFTWRRASRRVARASGPERLSPEWWRSAQGAKALRTRDYYRLEDEDGGRYWVFREGLYGQDDELGCSPSWWMQGLFP